MLKAVLDRGPSDPQDLGPQRGVGSDAGKSGPELHWIARRLDNMLVYWGCSAILQGWSIPW